MPGHRPVVALLLAIVALHPQAARGQDGGVSRAVESVTEYDVRRRIGIIAHDSMGGRNTPSPGLEKTAAYVAAEFKRLKLIPAGDDGSYIQRYPLDRVKLDGTGSFVTISRDGVNVTATAARNLVYVTGARTGTPVTGTPVFLAGSLDSAALRTAKVGGRIVMVLWGKRDANLTTRNRFLMGLLGRNPAAVVLLSNGDSASFARRVAAQSQERFALGVGAEGGAPVVSIPDRMAVPQLVAAGVDVAASRRANRLVVLDVAALRLTIGVRDEPGTEPSAPNVAAVLEGSDPVLRDEYVIFSAHMDHVGTAKGVGTDTIWNGADDDASGTAAVLELAEAFSQPGARPRRSLIFLTVSGEEKGLWGSAHFAGNMPAPPSHVVADLNIDMIGRNWRDTIVAIGKPNSDLGTTLDRVVREHPELHMTAIDDPWPNENFFVRSDHYNFARRGIPILFFFNGTHADYHQPSDSPEKIDAEKEMRIVRLLFHLGTAVANTTERPKWKGTKFARPAP